MNRNRINETLAKREQEKGARQNSEDQFEAATPSEDYEIKNKKQGGGFVVAIGFILAFAGVIGLAKGLVYLCSILGIN